MTTIAYKDGVLACDSAWSDDNRIIGTFTKIRRFDTGVLYGAAGGGDDRDLLNLLHNVTDPNDLPSIAALWEIQGDFSALMVFSDSRVFLITTAEDDCGVCQVSTPAAVGSGKLIAYGAMDAGADAVRAVEIACARDNASCLPAHSISLK